MCDASFVHAVGIVYEIFRRPNTFPSHQQNQRLAHEHADSLPVIDALDCTAGIVRVITIINCSGQRSKTYCLSAPAYRRAAAIST